MMAAQINTAVSGEIRHDEPMSRHTSWRVGGPAETFFKPADLDDLSQFLQQLDHETPIFWMGLGSNLLVRDGGLSGVVIAAAGVFNDLERIADQVVRAGVSVPCTKLARQCIRWGFGPSEFFAGIPGTVGGALAMNAGAHGGETWQRVQNVRTIDRFGVIRQRQPDDYKIAYRSVTGPPQEWFVEATFGFDP
jgi:UDP-N-acetylmuramate dehydrogenase